MQSLTDKAEQYLNGRWQQQRSYYSKQSARNKRWHQYLLLFSAVGTIIVPVMLNMPEVPKLVPTILSVLVAVALALDNIYHFGDNWLSFRQTSEALKQERVFFESGIDPYANTQTAFSIFVEKCEEIMCVEGTGYFKRYKSNQQNTSTPS